MNINVWKVLIFAAFVVAATVAVFPFPKSMVILYLETGELEQADEMLVQLQEKNPNDFEVLIASARMSTLQGDPFQSIDYLNTALMQKPRNLRALNMQADLLEWTLQPQKAMQAFTKLTKLQPKDRNAHQKIAWLARILDNSTAESMAVANIVLLDEQNKRIAAKAAKDPEFVSLVEPTLMNLSSKRLKDETDPEEVFLLQGIYPLYVNYKAEIEDGDQPDSLGYFTEYVNLYLRVGDLPEAEQAALHYDELTGSGLEKRLYLVEILRGNGMNEAAIEYLTKLDESFPEEERIMLAKAEIGSNIGDTDAQIDAYAKLSSRNPGKKEYKVGLVDALGEGGRFAEAFELMAELITLSSEVASYLQRLLQLALNSNDPDLMNRALEQKVENENEYPDILETKAGIYLTLNRPTEAQPIYLHLARITDQKRENLNLAFDAALYSGQSDLVTSTYDQAMKMYPDDRELMTRAAQGYLATEAPVDSYRVYLALVEKYRDRNDLEALIQAAGFSGESTYTVKAARLAQKYAPTDKTILVTAAEVLLWTSNLKDALPLLVRVAELEKGSKNSVARMLEVASFIGEDDVYYSTLKKAQALRPKDTGLIKQGALLLLASGNQKAAIEEFERYLSYVPDDEEARKQMAYLMLWEGDGETGWQEMEMLAGSSGMDTSFLREWAEYSEQAGLTDRAFNLYNMIYNTNPADREIAETVIRLATWTDNMPTAAKISARLSDSDPANLELARRAGEMYSQSENLAMAIRYYERAVGIDPTNTDALRELARNYGYNNQQTDLIRSYEKLLKLTTLTRDEERQLGRAYAETGKPLMAIPYLEAELAEDILDIDLAILLAEAYSIAGKRARSQSIYDRLLKENRQDADILADLGTRIYGTGNEARALEAFVQSLRLDPNNTLALRGSGFIYIDSDNLDHASRNLLRYNRLVKNDAEVLYRLGELYTLKNNEGRAHTYFRQALRILRALKKEQDVEEIEPAAAVTRALTAEGS